MEVMQSMRVLVTGGAGFIGSHVVDAYVAAGHEVTVVDNLSSGSIQNINPAAAFHEADIRDVEALDRVFSQSRPESVNHHAARAQVRESMDNPILYAEVNVLGSLNLLQMCRKHQVKKVVYASTGGAVYGEPEYLPVDENHPVNPLDPYGASKHHVEHYLYLYQLNWGLSYTVLRYANVYGPRQDPYGEAGVVAIFAVRMLGNDRAVVYGTGEQERDFVYVGDVARANLLALSEDSGRVFNIGTGVGTNINELYTRLGEATSYGGAETHGPAKPGEVFKIYLDVSRAREVLGWEPLTDLQGGIELTVEHFRKRP